jgi:hypothetical protein
MVLDEVHTDASIVHPEYSGNIEFNGGYLDALTVLFLLVRERICLGVRERDVR